MTPASPNVHTLLEHRGWLRRLARGLAQKSRLTLRATLQAVDAAAEELVSTGTAWSDADSLVNALHDEESRAAGRAYLAERGR